VSHAPDGLWVLSSAAVYADVAGFASHSHSYRQVTTEVVTRDNRPTRPGALLIDTCDATSHVTAHARVHVRCNMQICSNHRKVTSCSQHIQYVRRPMARRRLASVRPPLRCVLA
jgi:hypothetical protein